MGRVTKSALTAEQFTKAIESKFPYHITDNRFEVSVRSKLNVLTALKSKVLNSKVKNYLGDDLEQTITIQIQGENGLELPKSVDGNFTVYINYSLWFKGKLIYSKTKQGVENVPLALVQMYVNGSYYVPTSCGEAVARMLYEHNIIDAITLKEYDILDVFLVPTED